MTEDLQPVAPPGNLIVVPLTGEMIDVTDIGKVARVRHELREARQNLDAFNRALDEILVEEAERWGGKTLRVGGLVATVGPDSDLGWDMTVLPELLAAGLPQARYDALVTEVVSYKVSAAVANQIEKANETYGEIIGRARIRTPKRPTVKIEEEG